MKIFAHLIRAAALRYPDNIEMDISRQQFPKLIELPGNKVFDVIFQPPHFRTVGGWSALAEALG